MGFCAEVDLFIPGKYVEQSRENKSKYELSCWWTRADTFHTGCKIIWDEIKGMPLKELTAIVLFGGIYLEIKCFLSFCRSFSLSPLKQ